MARIARAGYARGCRAGRDIAAELERRKREERVVTFDDLLISQNRLLHQHPEVALALRARLAPCWSTNTRHRPYPGRVVRLLTEHGAPAPELFVVGDEKTIDLSLPRADVTVFNRPRERSRSCAAALREPPLAPAIVDFVNAVSAHSMRPWRRFTHGNLDGKPYKVKWSEEHRLQRSGSPATRLPSKLIVVPAGRTPTVRRQRARSRRIEADAIRAALCADDRRTSPGDRYAHGRGASGAIRDIALLLRSFATSRSIFRVSIGPARPGLSPAA